MPSMVFLKSMEQCFLSKKALYASSAIYTSPLVSKLAKLAVGQQMEHDPELECYNKQWRLEQPAFTSDTVGAVPPDMCGMAACGGISILHEVARAIDEQGVLRYPGFLSLVCQGVDLYHQDTIQQRELAIFHLQDSFIVKDCATYLFILWNTLAVAH